jgi:superfamily II DNA/RNA helicase
MNLTVWGCIRAAELAKWLTEMGWRSGHICAGLSQEKRMAVMKDMRQFKLRVLVCSDLVCKEKKKRRKRRRANVGFDIW